jgi:hypothetical protein
MCSEERRQTADIRQRRRGGDEPERPGRHHQHGGDDPVEQEQYRARRGDRDDRGVRHLQADETDLGGLTAACGQQSVHRHSAGIRGSDPKERDLLAWIGGEERVSPGDRAQKQVQSMEAEGDRNEPAVERADRRGDRRDGREDLLELRHAAETA